MFIDQYFTCYNIIKYIYIIVPQEIETEDAKANLLGLEKSHKIGSQ